MPTPAAPRRAPTLFSFTRIHGTENFVEHQRRDALGKRLDEKEARLAHELLHAFGYRLVIEGIRDVVARRGARDIGAHLQVDDHRLPDPALPVVDADDSFYAQRFDEDDVQSSISRSSYAGLQACPSPTPATRAAFIRTHWPACLRACAPDPSRGVHPPPRETLPAPQRARMRQCLGLKTRSLSGNGLQRPV